VLKTLKKITVIFLLFQILNLSEVYFQVWIFFQTSQTHAQSPTTGIYTIYRDNTGLDAIWTTAVNMSWDTQVSEDAEIPIVVWDIDFDLSVWGHYLVMYSIPVQSSAGSNRSEIQSWLRIDNTTNQIYGRASSYIRRANGDDDAYNEWAAVLDVAAWADLRIQMQRTDSNSATVRRTAGRSWVNILKLDDIWNYARLRPTANQAVTSAWQDIDVSTQDELDGWGFSRSGNDITLISQWHYLVTYNAGINITDSVRTNDELRLTLDGTEINGTRETLYARGSNSTQDAVGSYVGIIETTTSNQVLNFQIKRESSLSWANHNLQANRTGITITKLPDTADYVRIGEALGGQDMTVTTNTALTFDTTTEEDTASFVHDNISTERIDIQQDGDYMFFHSIYNARSDTANSLREAPFLEWEINGVAEQYGTSGSYNRSSNDAAGITSSSASSAGIIVPNMLTNDTVELVETNEATNALGTYQWQRMAVQGVNIDSLFTVSSLLNQSHFRLRDDSADLDVDSWWLASEDTGLTDVKRNQTKRIRITLANTWGASVSENTQFRLQWWDAVTGSCSSISTWNSFSVANDEWEMSASTNITPSWETSTNNFLANSEWYAFINTEAFDAGNAETSLVTWGTFTAGSFKEYEFSINPTDYAVTGHKYCFRLFDIENTKPLGLYNYPTLQIDGQSSFSYTDWGEAWSVTAPANGAWTTITFSGWPYINPVVVGSTNTHNDINEALVFEAKNVTSTWAEVRLCDSNAGNAIGCQTHLAETLWYIVVDADAASSIDGVEAGTFTADESFDTIGGSIVTNYWEAFSSTPYVFTAIQSSNGATPIVTRVSTSSITSFTSGICQQNSTDGCNATHPNETVWWIAIEPGVASFGNTRDIGTWVSTSPSQNWTSVTFTTTFASVPVVISQSVTNAWGQDAQIDEIQSVTTTGMQFRSCELDNDDDCDTHAIDTVRWFAIEQGVFTQAVSWTYYLDQTHFRWYGNNELIAPVSSLETENTPLSSIPVWNELRLRMLLQDGVNNLTADSLWFKLQYGTGSTCASLSSWTDVWELWSSKDWIFHDNTWVVDEAVLSSSLLFNANHTQESYIEWLPMPKNAASIAVWEWWEWDFSLEVWPDGFTSPDYCFRMVTADDQVLQYTQYPRVSLTDSTEPMMTTFSPADNTLRPVWNFEALYEYTESTSWVRLNSIGFTLEKWNGIAAYGPDISWTNASTGSLTHTGSNYSITWLDFGKYRATFNVTDNIGNTKTQEHIIYIDEIEFLISTGSIDIGAIGESATIFTSAWELTVTVKTLWAPFDVTMLPNTDLTLGLDTIPIWDTVTWFWYQEPPYSGTILSHSGGVVIGSQTGALNTNGDKNTYEYKVRYSALLDVIENYTAGSYTGSVDFGININY